MADRKTSRIFTRLFHHKHLLLGYFVTYFTVMIIPFLLGSLYYHQTARMVYEDTVNMNASVLHHTAAITDIRFEEISKFAEQLVINPDVSSFQVTASPFEYPNTYQIIELCKMLSANYSTNQMIENYFLFFHRNQTCITGKYAYRYSQFYDIYYRDSGLSYEEWLNAWEGMVPEQGYLRMELPLSGKMETCLAYAKPLLSISNNAGFLLIVLNDSLFSDLFSAIDISSGGALYIQDSRGNILYSAATSDTPIQDLQKMISRHSAGQKLLDAPSNFELTISGQKMLITSTTTSSTHFTYVFVQRADSITERVNSLRILVIVLLFFSFIVGTILCYLMSSKSSRPLNALLEELPANEESPVENAFERIHSSWYNIISRTQTMESTLTGHLPYLQYTFLSRLLQRDFSSLNEVETLADYIHFDYRNKCYTILLFRIYCDILPTQKVDLTFYMACRLALKEALKVLCPHMLCTEHGTDQVVCLYAMPVSESASLTEHISMLATEVKKMLPDEVCNNLYLYIGNTVTSLRDVVNSFENCQSIFQNRRSVSDSFPVIWYNENTSPSASYFYPYDVRSNIIQYTLYGREDSLHEALHNLLNRNIIENTLPPLLLQIFLNDLTSTLYTILDRLNPPQDTWQDIYQKLEELTHLDDLQKLHHICSLFQRLCAEASRRNAAAESDFINSVTVYLHENFASPDLSLTGVADYFHVNESYLSLSFKQHTGTNFSIYLETLRMKQAKMFLHTTERTITDIAASVGYYSSNTFCRAFKRFWGYTPTQCRTGQVPLQDKNK